MLAKVITPRHQSWNIAQSKERAQRLITYLVTTKADEKLLHSWSVNTPDDTQMAIQDFALTIEMNHRSKANKVEHILISFAETDAPDLRTLRAIEEQVAHTLGLSDHQRVVAVHKNTENLHLHIAANKLHPRTFKIQNHFQAFKRLETLCATLEKRYDLAPRALVAHKTERKCQSVSDFERRKGVESFQSWVKRTLQDHLETHLREPDVSWHSLQALLANYDCRVQLHANGIVIAHRTERLFTKASGISRTLSKPRLEAKLGPYEACEPSKVEAHTSYSPLPANTKHHALYFKFKASGASNWYTWLQEQAQSGSDEALSILQSRTSKNRVVHLNAIVGQRTVTISTAQPYRLTLNSRGQLVAYLDGTKCFTVAGERILVHALDHANLQRALAYAHKHFGTDVTFHGSKQFIAAMQALQNERAREYSLGR